MQLTDLIKCYPNIVPDHYCDYFVDFYENHKDKATKYQHSMYEQAPDFSELIFTTVSHKEEHVRFNNHVASLLNKAAVKFKDEFPLSNNFFPDKYSFEFLRIKKYDNNGMDEFKIHYDADSICSSARFMNIFCYLNDVEEGGETDFPDFGISFKPTKGSVVIFPPYWFFPHRGNKPISNAKYLLATNLHHSTCHDCQGCLVK